MHLLLDENQKKALGTSFVLQIAYSEHGELSRAHEEESIQAVFDSICSASPGSGTTPVEIRRVSQVELSFVRLWLLLASSGHYKATSMVVRFSED